MLRFVGLAFAFVLVWIVDAQCVHAQGSGFRPRGANAALSTRDFIASRPTVSPYLNLLRRESEVSAPNYQTLVRPALESRQRARQQSSSIRQLQSRVTNMQGQMAARNQQGSRFATGHPTRFMSYLHYYPGLNRR